MEELSIKRCPVCGGVLECKLSNFSIGADGRGGLLSLLCEQYEVDLYACPQCGKVELYTAGFLSESESEPPEDDRIVCPVCGTKHSPLIGCPTCALHNARSFQSSQACFSKVKKEHRPPWEK